MLVAAWPYFSLILALIVGSDSWGTQLLNNVDISAELTYEVRRQYHCRITENLGDSRLRDSIM
jgi:hypothetical protein